MSEDISFRPRLGYLTFSLIMMIFLLGFWIFFYLQITSFDEDISGEVFRPLIMPLVLGIVMCVAFLVIFPGVFFIRIKYILKANSLVVNRYFKTYEIYYTSIKSVEEVRDSSVFFFNFTPSVASSKQIWIRFTDINGREDMVNISPAKKHEFLSSLRSRIKDPGVFVSEGERQADVKYQSWKNLTPGKKLAYIVYFAVIIAVFAAINILL